MTDLRTAAQQALEALNPMQNNRDDTAIQRAITALRAALEQPERAQQQRDAGFTRRPTIREMSEPEQPEQEPIPFSGADEKTPVFGRRWRIAKDGFGLQLDDDGPYVHIDDALSVLHAALEQPKQAEPDVEYYGLEPWEVPQHIPFATAIYPAHSPDKPFLALGDCAHLYRDAAKCVPLYTHPPRREWRGLTEDELTAFGIIHSRYQEESLETGGWFDFARAIEAALKERNA